MPQKRDTQDLQLRDLIDIRVLQQVQDWFSATTGIPAVIRDADGAMITRPSGGSPFCALIAGSEKGRNWCARSHREAAAQFRKCDSPTKYTCHAGLTQFAAPIRVKDYYFGSVVVGDRPQKPLTRAQILEIAERCEVDAEALGRAAQDMVLWSESDMGAAVDFLHTIANTLATLCFQGYQLKASLRELSTVYEVSQRLTGRFNLDEVLDLIVSSIANALDVKACSLRLLDAGGEELIPKASHNLSERYMSKGPVRVAESPNDQAAMRGEVVYVADMATDPRVRYPKEAKEEGLVSSLVVGLVTQDHPIGTVHVYTGRPHEFSDDEVRLFRMLANQAAIAIESARLHEEELAKERLDSELALAGVIQRQLLPREMPDVEGFEILAKSVPSREVGGDFYDFVSLPENHLGVAIGDVSGKSVAGAILMAATRMALRAQIAATYAAKDIVSAVNQILCRDTRPLEFVTLFYGAIDAPNRRMTYCNAGHMPGLLLRGDKTEFLETGGTVVGSIEWAEYEEETVDLQAGDVLFLYTDGVVEAMNEKDELFGQNRLIDTLRGALDQPAAALLAAVERAVRRFVGQGPQADDMAMVVIRVK